MLQCKLYTSWKSIFLQLYSGAAQHSSACCQDAVCLQNHKSTNELLSLNGHAFIFFSKAPNLLNSLQATVHGRALEFIIFIIILCVRLPFKMILSSVIGGLFVCFRSPGFP